MSFAGLSGGLPPNRAYDFAHTTGDPTLDSLLVGVRWTATDLTYAFPPDEAAWGATLPEEVLGVLPPGADFQRAVDLILAGTSSVAGGTLARFGSVASFTNLTFTRAAGGDAPTLRLGLAENLSDVGLYGFARFPGDGSFFLSSTPTHGRAGDVWVTADEARELPDGPFFVAGTPFGGNGWRLLLHEIGHALGLAHPFSGAEVGTLPRVTMPADRDGTEFSVMAYKSHPGGDFFAPVEQGNAPQSWMIYDIRALQHLYGANYATQSGNTTYSWDPATGEMFIDGIGQGAGPVNRILLSIWDGGGRDTYDASAHAGGVVLDLRPGHGSVLSAAQLAVLFEGTGGATPQPAVRAQANVWNAFLANDDPRSLIEDAIGGLGDDRIIGNQAANHLRGGGGADSLEGGLGADTLDGGLGADSLSGGAGHDVYLVDEAADVILEGRDGGHDAVIASVAYTLGRGVEELRLAEGVAGLSGTGNGAANRLAGNALANTLAGGGGDDIVTGQDGDDVLAGQSGIDILLGGAGDDTLMGGAGADTLLGEAGSDSLHGSDGEDVLAGGEGTDTMRGGAGRDTYYVDSTADRIIEADDGSMDFVITSVAYRMAANLERMELLEGALIGIGNAVDNAISGSLSDERLDGQGGNDTLYAAQGADTLLGGDGRDTLRGGSDDDLLRGGAGADVLFADDFGVDDGADRLLGEDGNDELIAIYGPDTLDGGAGDDLLRGGGGADRLLGGEGADTLRGSPLLGDPDGQVDMLRGGAGDDVYEQVETHDLVREADGGGADTVYALGTYTLPGFVEVLMVNAGNARGNALDNGVYGGSDSAWLSGMAGDDTLGGGLGADTLQGGADFDIFYYNASAGGRDLLWDFSLTEDQVWLDGLFADVDAVLAALTEEDGHAVLVLPEAWGSIVFRNIGRAAIDSDEFLLN